MKNKKGFTLVEVLVVIVILGVVVAIAVPSVLSIQARTKKNMYCTMIQIIEKNAIRWGQKNDETIYNLPEKSLYISVQDLIDSGFVDTEDMENNKIIDPRDKTPIEESILVYVKNNRINAKIDNQDVIDTCGGE